ncbi:MAG TPA: hypothetical protein DCL81_00790 [Algoriphagus sp.]|jgi:hypothetical protein|uniref:hypothetical protein n=3 Tax=Algoriphagus TaxID=246875 RepID=UPI000C972028|nr:hypothetical protein [Algoriphagus sp.]HAD52682.1 hypothetical protein [Algoriphagus sp.]HAH35126.1 hypothetical protein [Algoriphagus sp.]HCX74976.1 hypothetical protein [Algoriphagus sp.]|tara:strand:- start:384 stop:857 length:474 start_codon:yes stop_codon:yes gene_type:complete
MKTPTLNQIWSQVHPDDTIPQIIEKICGELIGKGTYRDVYELKANPRYVVKIERDMSTGRFCNATEYVNWCDLRFWDFIEPWLCPCVRITETSQVLIQKRAKPIESIDQLPKEVPAIFTDLKRSNWGILNKRAVITDYPYLRHVFTQKMRKPKWKDY